MGFFVIKQVVEQEQGGQGSWFEIADFNFAYQLPESPWIRDTAPPAAYRANLLALRHEALDAHIVLAGMNFQDKSPQPGDIRERLLERLEQLFEELDPIEESGATWANQPAVKYTFRGISRGQDAVCAGEAYGISFQGIAYWLIAWAPERDVAGLASDFTQLRDRFRLLDYRQDWKPKSQPYAVFVGEEANYRLIDSDRWWKPAPSEPRDVDAKADLYLWAEYRVRQKADYRPRAELVVYILDPVDDDPLASVLKYVKDRYEKERELFGETRVQELTDEPLGDPSAFTEGAKIPTMRLHADSTRDSNRSKLHVLSAITVGNKVIGLEARCPWEYRSLWERRLIHIAGSLQPGRE